MNAFNLPIANFMAILFHAVKVAELVYTYDCVLPHLAEDIIYPKDNPELKINVLIVPDG